MWVHGPLFKFFFVLLCFFILPEKAKAQNTTTKKTVGVVLSGGVARGFAFLGALEVLVTNGVPIDHLVGTSAGALVTGLYASGYSFQTVTEILEEMRLHQNDIIKLKSPPLDSVLDIRGFEMIYTALVADTKLENTSPRLVVTATELKPGAPAYLTSGNLANAVRASISLPIVFAPAEINDKYFVDGGVRSPSPVGIAKELGSDIVIWLRPAPEERPTKPNSLFNNFFLTLNAVTGNPNAQEPELSVPIKFADTLYFDFDRSQELMARGRAAGLLVLPEALKLLQENNIPLNPIGDPHSNNPINNQWKTKFVDGLSKARALPMDLRIAPQIAIAPNANEFGTRPNAPSQGFGLGAQFEHGFLGPLLLQFGVHNPFAAQATSPYFGLQYRALNGLNNDLMFSFDYDPSRRPSAAPWVLAAQYQQTNVQDQNTWSAKFAIEREAIEAKLQWQPIKNLKLQLDNRFGYGLFAPGNWWRAEASLSTHFGFYPWVLRAEILYGQLFGNTNNAEQFSLGANSLMRAYANDTAIGSAIASFHAELAYRWRYPNVGQLLWAEPEAKIFFDAGVVNPNANWTAQAQWLWDTGLGLSVNTKIFGLFPASFGLDVGFAPNSWNIGFYTRPALP